MIKEDFNFHTHTFRCGHAFGKEEEYIKAAIDKNIRVLGFSDHMPYYPLFVNDIEQRMTYFDIPDYYYTIKNLKKKYYEDITILFGFEGEYDELQLKHLITLGNISDFMILGQHYVRGENPNNNYLYPQKYADIIIRGIKSGIFDILGHPDYFLRFRDSISFDTLSSTNKSYFGSKKRYLEAYNEETNKAIRRILEVAQETKIPIELNYGAIYDDERQSDGYCYYPHPFFWDIAKNYKITVFPAIDAHSPDQISSFSIEFFEKELNTKLTELLTTSEGLSFQYSSAFLAKTQKYFPGIYNAETVYIINLVEKNKDKLSFSNWKRALITILQKVLLDEYEKLQTSKNRIKFYFSNQAIDWSTYQLYTPEKAEELINRQIEVEENALVELNELINICINILKSTPEIKTNSLEESLKIFYTQIDRMYNNYGRLKQMLVKGI